MPANACAKVSCISRASRWRSSTTADHVAAFMELLAAGIANRLWLKTSCSTRIILALLGHRFAGCCLSYQSIALYIDKREFEKNWLSLGGPGSGIGYKFLIS